MQKRWNRYSLSSLAENKEDKFGTLFLSPLGQVDFSHIKILHKGVDTIRQLYAGIPLEDPLLAIQTAYDAGFNEYVQIDTQEWIVSSGGKSGYRYRLTNMLKGYIVFLGSRYAEMDKEGDHLKIEVSPHAINGKDVSEIQSELDEVAQSLISYARPTGCAVHLAVDVQGWEPPNDFENRFVTRSKRRASFNSIDKAEFDLNEIAAIYGDRESFLFGGAATLQFAMYRKDREAKKRKKYDYWKRIWERQTDEDFQPVLQPEQAVWRFEARFHQSVIKQFALGMDTQLNNFKQVADHLTGLWQYATNSYRLDESRTYIDPFWQLLQEQEILTPLSDFSYKRKTKEPGEASKVNFRLAFGNLITLYASNGIKARDAVKYLKNSGIWNHVDQWCWDMQLSPSAFEQWLQKEITKRRLMRAAS